MMPNKMQFIALCGKLIRVFFAILTKGVDYSPEKMLTWSSQLE
jgi:transposase